MKEKIVLALSFLLGLLTVQACTVIRYVDGGADDPDPPGPGEPAEIDVLVALNFDPNASNLADTYQEIVDGWVGALDATPGLQVRMVGIAPLRRRVGAQVPIVSNYDSEALVAQLVSHYTTGRGAAFLTPSGAHDYANVIELGSALDETPLYDSETGQPGMGAAYFERPADGFVILVVSPLAAECGGDNCIVVADDVARQLTATQDGIARWINFPTDDGLAPDRIHWVLATAPEVQDYASMQAHCTAFPNFPFAVLDFIQPSAAFHSRVASQVIEAGGRAQTLDLCRLLSSDGPLTAETAAAAISTHLNGS